MKKNNNVWKGVLIGLIAFVVCLLVLVVGLKAIKNKQKPDSIDKPNVVAKEEDKKTSESNEKSNEIKDSEVYLAETPARKLLKIDFDDGMLSYNPCVPAYQTEQGGTNITNLDRFYLQDHMIDVLAQNNFVVTNSNYSEFFDVYEDNRYLQLPSFITTDSIMHTYHLYFAMLQKNTELNYLSKELNNISKRMYEKSLDNREKLIGTEWEDAASRVVAYFAVGSILMGNQVEVPDYLSEIVLPETGFIESADGIHNSMLIDEMEDYSQYKPRGYYEGNEQLEKYFRTMMWYGRRNFKQSEDVETRMALLINAYMDDETLASWEKVYSITSFFAGSSDDCGPYEYMPLIAEAYGADFAIDKLPGDEKSWEKYKELISSLEAPKINSIVFVDEVTDDTDRLSEGKGFRFMGQRFSLDASIFTQLCYSKVRENSAGELRMLPTALDVPAALGSEFAVNQLKSQGSFDFKNYKENLENTQKEISEAPETLWSASLYGGWLNTLNPLLTKKGDGYPSFMTNDAWAAKSVETYLGSWTELKHDTVLYSKQFMAEMGGPDIEEDSRGYVEPEPELYNRLYALTNDTTKGLKDFGIISSEDEENLGILADLALNLREISIKELNNQSLDDADYTFIEEYGGNLEHLWRKTITEVDDDRYVDPSEYPCALVTDVATDPNGSVLQEAIGGASLIYVVFPIDGELHLGRGTVFTYYEFENSISNRLTDSDWRRMIGMELTDDMEYLEPADVPHPEWTSSYRTDYVYNYDY